MKYWPLWRLKPACLWSHHADGGVGGRIHASKLEGGNSTARKDNVSPSHLCLGVAKLVLGYIDVECCRGRHLLVLSSVHAEKSLNLLLRFLVKHRFLDERLRVFRSSRRGRSSLLVQLRRIQTAINSACTSTRTGASASNQQPARTRGAIDIPVVGWTKAARA